MSYTKLNLADGQVFDAGHLNHIEEGIAEVERCFLSAPDAGDPYYLPEIVVPSVPVGISISTRNASFTETTTMVLQIRLDAAPTDDVTLVFTTGGSVTLDKQSMVFTTANWGTVQYLDLSYNGEALSADLTDTINITASGGNYDGMTDAISVTILSENSGDSGDNDDSGSGEVDESTIFDNMRTATASDFAASEYVDGIAIGSDGVVTGSGSATYPALMVSGSGDVSAVEYENGNGLGLWVICGKSADGNYIGFGDASMGSLGYSAKFVDGGCTPTSGLSADVNDAISCAAGTKVHIRRVGTVVSAYEYVGNNWLLRFKIDLASVPTFDSADYAINAVGVLLGSSYQTMKNARVYNG